MQRVGQHHVGLRLAVLLLSLTAYSCSSTGLLDGATSVWSISDPQNDGTLRHPGHPQINEGTFDLTAFELWESDTQYIAVATFASVVRPITNVRLSEDRRATIFPQTIDIYLDTASGAGSIETLPDRGVRVPANEGWDQVLVMSSIRDMTDAGVTYTTHLMARGRTLIGVFDKSEVDGPIQGALVLVLASSPRGDGRVRLASRFKGVCTDWNPNRCTLLGSGPPVMDASAPIDDKAPVALTYFGDTPRPEPKTVPIVFTRGRLLGAAPVTSKRIKQGHIATVFSDDGQAVASAIVVSVVDDTASLEIIGDTALEQAASVAFQETER